MISIHALVKRATPQNTRQPTGQEISIHALVKRATALRGVKGGVRNISIHALVKRATVPATRPAERDGNFNPRPREEGD